MKYLATFSLLGALCLAAPATGWSKDKHHDHHDHYDGRDYRHYHSSVIYRSYRPYPYYGYGYYPGYYARPSVGLSFSTAPGYRSYSYSDTRYDDDLAVDVQRALARRGFYRGSIDGEVGPGTRSAIREYQYRNRLEVTGRVDRSLLRSLGVS